MEDGASVNASNSCIISVRIKLADPSFFINQFAIYIKKQFSIQSFAVTVNNADNVIDFSNFNFRLNKNRNRILITVVRFSRAAFVG